MLNLKFLILWLHSVSPSTLQFSHTRCISGDTPMGAICLMPLCLYSSWTCPLSIRQTLKMLPSFSSNVTWSTRHLSTPIPRKISCCVCKELLRPHAHLSPFAQSSIQDNCLFSSLSPQLDCDGSVHVLYTCTNPTLGGYTE